MSLTIERTVSFSTVARGRVKLATTTVPQERPLGRIPRISKFMALAIRFEGLIRDGVVQDYVSIARLGHVTRTRITQIMNLRLLDPQIQEEILLLPRVERGTSRIHMRLVLPIAQTPDWAKQRRMWTTLKNKVGI